MTLPHATVPISAVENETRTVEEARLAALHRYDILDTLPEPQFDRLVSMAAKVFHQPMALISFIDDDRQWFKANHGVPFPEVPRCDSFCAVAIHHDGVMLIPDASLNETFRIYPGVVGDPHIRSYAGAPLVTPDGYKIGTFCVFGPEPRTFTDDDRELLTSFAAMAMDELRLRQALEELNQAAMTDSLTGLPNRVSFRQQLAQACRRADTSGEKVVVGLLDIDHFKSINDTFGHAAGDELLREVARRLKAATATSDLVARLSGDEFTLLFTDVRSVADMGRVTRRLEGSFALPFLIERQEVFVHWSLGLSVYPDDARELDGLLSSADAAMYRVKRGGGHSPYRENDHRSGPDIERLRALHGAEGKNEFQLYYQPIVHAESHQVVGHEALLRWMRPSGMVSPLDFIPLAESSRLIVPIGRWVLKQAVEAIRTDRVWRASVNVSALEFHQPDFAPYLQGLLEESGIEPRRLILELTESSMLEPQFVSVLGDIHALGVRTALDDFGTGYSSLTALMNLPVQIVKIDRTFTANIGQDTPEGKKATNVVKGIVTLAAAYDLPTIAEGVETPEQAELLTTLGCRYLQGYLFGRPEPLP